MREIRRVREAAPGARTLAWVEDRLYDVAAGWRLSLDGQAAGRGFGDYGEEFDAVTVSPLGDVVALVASTGTKGLLLRPDGRLIREVNRSKAYAAAYRYPLVLYTLPDGRTGIVHCPDNYATLEIEDAVTGARLTASADRKPIDVCHSRLAVSPSGRYLLTAGWVWQPWDTLFVYDLPRALTEPDTFDARDDLFGRRGLIQAEVAGACFVGDDVVLSTTSEPNEPEEPDDLGPNMLARWSAPDRRFLWQRRLDHTPGDLVPLGGNVLALYQHPRLYDANDGTLLAEWPDLPTGEASSSIVWHKHFSGPARVAVDEAGLRFAVTDGEHVTVVYLAA